MYIGNWIALVIACLLVLAIVVASLRSRRERSAAPPRHGSIPADQPKHDQAALITIGTVAADGARSTLG